METKHTLDRMRKDPPSPDVFQSAVMVRALLGDMVADGLLDAVRQVGRHHYLCAYLNGYRNNPFRSKKAASTGGEPGRTRMGRDFEIILDHPVPIQIDGELVGEVECIKVGVDKESIRIKIPNDQLPETGRSAA